MLEGAVMDDLEQIRIGNPDGEAVLLLQGAQLLTWQPEGEAPVIWLSDRARYVKGKSVRGGIPICWPWFGPHASEPSYPAHGIARNLDWELVESHESGAKLRLIPQSPFWPHTSMVECRFTVGKALEVELVTHNTGSEPFELGCALHTYFSVSDATDVEVLGLDNTSYIDKVEGGRKIQDGPVRISGEVDRVYVGTDSDCILVDPGLNRKIRIEKQGSRSTVVWNPGAEKAEKFGDMGSHLGMLCIETGNAADDVVTVQPGQSHRLWARYSVEKLGKNALRSPPKGLYVL